MNERASRTPDIVVAQVIRRRAMLLDYAKLSAPNDPRRARRLIALGIFPACLAAVLLCWWLSSPPPVQDVTMH